MDAFFTWDYLLSYAGCVLVTGLLTQGLKALFKKVPPQIISYVIALTAGSQLAAKCAVAAIKKPFEVTDCSGM